MSAERKHSSRWWRRRSVRVSDLPTLEVAVPGDGMLHPLCLVALLLLIANDRWFKAAYPGLISGKLSDLAGMFFFPTLVVALVEILLSLLRRPWLVSLNAVRVSYLLTGLVFAAINTIPGCAMAYVDLMRVFWGSVSQRIGQSISHTLDISDLIALGSLIPSYRLQVIRHKV